MTALELKTQRSGNNLKVLLQGEQEGEVFSDRIGIWGNSAGIETGCFALIRETPHPNDERLRSLVAGRP